MRTAKQRKRTSFSARRTPKQPSVLWSCELSVFFGVRRRWRRV